MSNELTIKKAKHDGYVVLDRGGAGYETILLFAGSLSACLLFINSYYSEKKSEG